MITEWLISVGSGFGQWVASLFPVLELPEQLVDLDDTVNTILSYGEGMGAFVDWTAIGIIAGIPLAVWALGLVVKGVRVLIGHIPFIGGKG